MTHGSATPCPVVKELHDASDQCRALEMVEAYDCGDSSSCAAGHSRASHRHVLLQYCHSAVQEPRFTNPFQAASKARKLCFSVLCDQWSASFKSLMQPDVPKIAPFSLRGPSTNVPITKRSVSQRPNFPGKVTFMPKVTVCTDNPSQPEVLVYLDYFHTWPGKSWKLRKSTRSHALPFSCKVSSLWRSLDALCPDSSTVRPHDPFLPPCESQEPLSRSAVSIRDNHPHGSKVCSRLIFSCSPRTPLSDITNTTKGFDAFMDLNRQDIHSSDAVSFMQRPAPGPHACKQSPFPDGAHNVLEEVAQGQADPAPPDPPSASDEIASDGYSASVATDSSGIAPPSSVGHRQEAILYHLADPPIRVFLDWSDYDTMIQEIAFHLSRNPVEVLDAYEVLPYPGDTPDGVTPIIVHLFDDVAVGQPAKLVLLDVELHGHSFEVNYAVGPTTTRSVVRLPERCNRHSVLLAANVDLYCRQEADVCFVWHGHTRWADDDHRIRQLQHGEYFRVAVPPTSRFLCSTVEAVALSQQGLSDQEMLDHMTGAEVGLNLSPSLLSSESVRNLARDGSPLDEDDEELFQAFQDHLVIIPGSISTPSATGPSKTCAPALNQGERRDDNRPCDAIELPSATSEGSFYQFNPDAPVVPDNDPVDEVVSMHFDTLATQWLAAARTWDESVPSARFITWFVSPAIGRRFCLDSRDVVLYGDMEHWRHHILQTWADQLDVRVPEAIISVSPHPSDLEPGIAGHVIVQQHPLPNHAVTLVTIVDPAVNNGNLHRQAHVLDDRSRPEDVLFFAGYHIDCPRIAVCQVSLRDIQLPPQRPIRISDGDAFEVRIFRTFLPDNWIPPVIPRLAVTDEVGFLQVSSNLNAHQQVMPSEHGHCDHDSSLQLASPRTCSFTEEFVNAVRRLSESQEQEAPPFLVNAADVTLPTALTELWELHQTDLLSALPEEDLQIRVETWFLDHVNLDRCYYSRIVTLSSDTSTWITTLLRHWSDRRQESARMDFALVYPSSEDQAADTSAQLILTQFPQEELRSVLLSVYDTGRPAQMPRTFALVHGASISLRSVLEEVRLTQDCPPHVQHNECVLWFGSTVIPEQRQAFVRSGNAFRLCIRRGQLIPLQDLLALPDEMLRRQLQEAIHGEIYRRPPGPRFPGDALAANSLPEVPAASSAASSGALAGTRRPRLLPWIDTLNQLFAHHSATELLEEGPVLYIQTWYVHGDSHLWCTEPRAVRLTSDFTQWRTAITQAWQNRIQGSLPAEYWVVQPHPPFSPQQGLTVHVIISQFVQSEQAAVLLTATQDHSASAACQHAAYVLPRRSLCEDLARFAVPPWFRTSMMTVLFEGTAYPFAAHVHLHSGANVVVQYGEFDRPSPVGDTDNMMLLQLRHQVISARTEPQPQFAPQPRPIFLEQVIPDPEDDICDIPLSIGQFLQSSNQSWVVCAWEMPHGNTETVLLAPTDTVGAHTAQEFRTKHDFLRPVSQLFAIRFRRPEWNLHDEQLFVGSFQEPATDRAIVWCVRYQADGAVYGVRTFSTTTPAPLLRQCLSIQHGTKIRCNGKILSSIVHFQHGDVLEFHAAPCHERFDLIRSHDRVQLCLEASLPAPGSSFDEDRNAMLILQQPDLIGKLRSADSWHFALLPEGLDIHRATYEALHCQPFACLDKPDTLELYVDGATSSNSSAWAVVVVGLSAGGRTFYGCITGVTQNLS